MRCMQLRYMHRKDNDILLIQLRKNGDDSLQSTEVNLTNKSQNMKLECQNTILADIVLYIWLLSKVTLCGVSPGPNQSGYIILSSSLVGK